MQEEGMKEVHKRSVNNCVNVMTCGVQPGNFTLPDIVFFMVGSV